MTDPAAVLAFLAVPILEFGFLNVNAYTTGWRDLARHYRGALPPKETWILRPTLGEVLTDAPVLAMNDAEFEDSTMKIGATEAGLHLAEPPFTRPFHPTLL